MIPILALAFCCPPQAPTPAEILRGVHHEVVVESEVAAVEKALAATPDGTLRGIASLPLAAELRAAGVGALDRAATLLDYPDPTRVLEDVVARTRLAWGFADQAVEVGPKPDLREFERVCSHSYRDLIQALGSGRDLSRVAPELHAAVDQVRRSLENLDELSAEDAALLTSRLERIGKVEQDVVHRLAERVVRAALALDRDDFRAAMKRLPVRAGRSDGAVLGDVLLDRDTAFGRMVVGGFGPNSYDCSQIDVIVDVGGDDEYRGPAGGADGLRRFAVVVDLDGADRYQGGNGALGSATFGIGVLVDVAGDDHYAAESRSAGFGLAGVGVLLDLAGDDRYELGDQSGGVGLAGSGLFLDAAGSDSVTAGVQSLGCGLPGGLGLCLDGGGHDVRRLGVESKRVADVRDASTRTDREDSGRLQDVSVGLGAGVGALPLLSGGVGLFVDLGPEPDRYEAGGLALGVGLRGGVGVFRDAGGDDSYRAGDVALGGAYANGLGVLRDEGGADTYEAAHLALGSASGGAIALFVDAGDGDDSYTATAPGLGGARRGAVGGFVDLGGVDRYTLRHGNADWRIAAVGLAVGVFVDLGQGADRHAFERIQAPENDRTRRVDAGDEQHPARQFFVDR